MYGLVSCDRLRLNYRDVHVSTEYERTLVARGKEPRHRVECIGTCYDRRRNPRGVGAARGHRVCGVFPHLRMRQA